jgi:hypothetical protein
MDELGETVRQRRTQARQIRGIAIESGQCRVGVGLAEERHPPGEALVEDETQRVEVGPAVELLPAHLLGRQVLRRAHHHVGTREIVTVDAEAFGNAEVGQQDATVRSDQDVAGLDVAVNQPGAVRGVERRGDARTDVNGEICAETVLLVEQLSKALAVDELHDDGESTAVAVGVFDRVIDGHDVGMTQLGDRDRLTAEPLGDNWIGRECRLQQLHGDLPGQRQIGRQPDLGHATLREPSFQLVTLGEDRRRNGWGAGCTRDRC